MSYFSSTEVAEGYANHRPYFHPLVIAKIRACLNLDQVQRALDVGCGTGLSAVALTALADQVVGIDRSSAMLEAAVQRENLHYYPYPAEQIPLPDASFDLITVGGALNWIDRDHFFPEAKRLLRPAGWVIIYDHSVRGVMQENPAFGHWYRQEFLERCPKPPRDERPLTPAECQSYDFVFAHQETYSHDISFSREQCANYLLTQSNVTAIITQGAATYDGIREWLMAGLAPFFDSSPKDLLFGGYIWYLQSKVR